MNAKIQHITILNPALHSRIFFKQARSQQAAGFDVEILGIDPANKSYYVEGVKIIPFSPLKRLSFYRFFRHFQLFFATLRSKADVCQIHTPELLGVAWLLKMFCGRKIIYDVHEDYSKNILHTPYYGRFFTRPLAWAVRQLEKLAVRFWVDGVFYAENCFANCLNAKESQWIVVGNLFQSSLSEPVTVATPKVPVMLYTGTLAEEWGVFRVIELWEKLNRRLPVFLQIVGHSQHPEVVREIQCRVKNSGFAERFALIGGLEYAPFPEIEKAIGACSFGAALYRVHAGIQDRIPTKFYEYMAYGKPLLFSANPVWNRLNEELNFGFPLSYPFSDEEVERIVRQIEQGLPDCYTSPLPQSAYSWADEAEKMVDFLRKMIEK